MARGKAEDAGGLTPAKDDNAAPYHFAPRTLPIFMCADYMLSRCALRGLLDPAARGPVPGLVALPSGHGCLGGGAPTTVGRMGGKVARPGATGGKKRGRRGRSPEKNRPEGGKLPNTPLLFAENGV